VDSKVNEGSRFSFLVPLALSLEEDARSPLMSSGRSDQSPYHSIRTRTSSHSSEIESLVEALTSNHLSSVSGRSSPQAGRKDAIMSSPHHGSTPGTMEVRPVKIDSYELDIAMTRRLLPLKSIVQPQAPAADHAADLTKLRILIVEV
jgi:hypothetical protein